GRICFVHLTANSAGGGGAQQVSYGAGRQAVQRAHLLRASAPASVAKSSTPAAPGDSSMAFIVKAGRFSLASDSQTILAAVHNFDAGTSYGLEGEWRSAQGLAFGLEVLSHAYDYTVGVSGGTATANLVMVNAKQYFRTGQTAQPYIGAGLGGVSVEFSGATTGSAGGYALQAMTGVVFQWEHVGLYTEIKYQKAEAQDSAGQTVDASGLGLYTGLIVRF
ncbi:MAG: porin family protein, partial [Gammaproteobacteria bacterium]|nr:porin family protein [Gammaproteobacteria bacterium]